VEADQEQITSLTGEPEDERAESDRELSRIPLLASLGVLTVTILATLSATLAAVSAYQENVANRSRQLWASYAVALTIQEDNAASGAQQTDDAGSVAYWRAVFAQTMAMAASSPAVRSELQQEAVADAQAAQSAPRSGAATPYLEGPPDRSMCSQFVTDFPATSDGFEQVGTQSDCAVQFATAYGETAEGFLRNERTYLAIASALAIALFLFALSRTLLLAPMQVMFLCVAAAVTVGCVVIGTYELAWRSATQPNGAAIESYENDEPARAVALDPGYAAAWEERGENDTRCAPAVHDFAEAEQLDPSAPNENELAAAETACGDLGDAQSVLISALHSSDIPSNSWVFGTALEYLLVVGQTKEADQNLQAAIDYMRSVAAGDHTAERGWVYQDLWFSSLLRDRQWIEDDAPDGSGLPFIHEVEADEAALDHAEATGQRLPTRPMTGVTISDLTDQVGTVSPGPAAADPSPSFLSPSQLRPPRGVTLDTPLRVGFRYAGLEAGDVVSLIWYDTADRASDVAETFEIVGTAGGPSPGTGTYTTPGWIFAPSGSYRLVVVVNSTFGAESQVSVPAEGG